MRTGGSFGLREAGAAWKGPGSARRQTEEIKCTIGHEGCPGNGWIDINAAGKPVDGTLVSGSCRVALDRLSCVQLLGGLERADPCPPLTLPRSSPDRVLALAFGVGVVGKPISAA